MLDDYSKYQQGIIKRYYANQDKILIRKLAELVSDLYLAEGKQRQKLWKSALSALVKLEVPQQQIDHLLSRDDPALLAELVKKMESN